MSILENGKERTILICLNDTVPALQNDNKCAPKIQFTVHHAETKRRCHKVSASDVFRCAESPARAGAPKLRQQFLVFGMFLFGAPKNSKLAIMHNIASPTLLLHFALIRVGLRRFRSLCRTVVRSLRYPGIGIFSPLRIPYNQVDFHRCCTGRMPFCSMNSAV